MRTIIQRVNEAWVEVESARTAAICRGLLALVGIERTDTEAQVAWTAEKIANLRIFEDADGKMNLSLLDLGPAEASVLLVPNFTVAGDASRGRRPSFDSAMRPERAEPMFQQLARRIADTGITVQTGIFRAHMHVGLVNDGPVTIVLETG